MKNSNDVKFNLKTTEAGLYRPIGSGTSGAARAEKALRAAGLSEVIDDPASVLGGEPPDPELEAELCRQLGQWFDDSEL